MQFSSFNNQVGAGWSLDVSSTCLEQLLGCYHYVQALLRFHLVLQAVWDDQLQHAVTESPRRVHHLTVKRKPLKSLNSSGLATFESLHAICPTTTDRGPHLIRGTL